jgi:hypothetical protein
VREARKSGTATIASATTLYTLSPAANVAMGRSPSGVATNVSGDAQSHSVQPGGQVPPVCCGSTQPVVLPTGPGTVQHNMPVMQHSWSQQMVLGPQSTFGAHGGVPQSPLSQYGDAPGQATPQSPQLPTSLLGFTHAPLQHRNPAMQLSQVPPLPLVLVLAPPLPEPLEVLPLLPVLVVVSSPHAATRNSVIPAAPNQALHPSM